MNASFLRASVGPVAVICLTVALAVIAASPALAQSALPDTHRTPGAVDPEVRQDNIASTICVRGWTRTIRPPWQYTSALKRKQIREFGYADRRMGDYEEDHLVPLDLGGSPTDPRNLWPEPRTSADGWNANLKDELEATLVRSSVPAGCRWQMPSTQSRRTGSRPTGCT